MSHWLGCSSEIVAGKSSLAREALIAVLLIAGMLAFLVGCGAEIHHG